ncbi:hypothetical protein GCM10010299_44000 [Streptomyces tanashiensis]|nr:hypothetical protein GCM10010299_44000 [Streptomyces tanashiensis]
MPPRASSAAMIDRRCRRRLLARRGGALAVLRLRLDDLVEGIGVVVVAGQVLHGHGVHAYERALDLLVAHVALLAHGCAYPGHLRTFPGPETLGAGMSTCAE